MKYRILGRTGLRVSVIGLGTWQLGGEWGRDYAQDEADAILDAARAAGLNLVDTAECYGDHRSESLIGDHLRRRGRDGWIVATKFGHRFNGFMNRAEAFSPAEVMEQLEASLRALQVGTIDLYQFHSGSDAQFEQEELWAALDRARRAGKIRHLGLSIRGKGSELQVRRAAEVGADVLQVIYNRLDRRPETAVFPEARRRGLGVLARVPLASGLLGGRYGPGAAFAANDVRSTFDADEMRRRFAELDGVRREVPPDVPMARWALAWCLRNEAVSCVIPGCRTPHQAAENALAADLVEA